MPPRITQRDIARAAGVSHVTVSLALRKHWTIPAETRHRIERIARELGYVPDPMLAGLSAYRMSRRPAAYQSNIAWISPHRRSEMQRVHYLREYYEGAVERSNELGFKIEEFLFDDRKGSGIGLRRVLAAKGIRGLILAPSKAINEEFPMDLGAFSAVRIGYSYKAPVLHTVSNAQFRTALLTVHRLVELGYRRIGVLLWRKFDSRTNWNFCGGFGAGQQILPKRNRVEPFYLDLDGNEDDAVLWVGRNKVDCLIDCSGRLYTKLKAAGLCIPERIGYASLSLQKNNPEISGMYQNSTRIGAAAVDLLVGMMQRGERGIPETPFHLHVESQWHEGKTAFPSGV